MKQQQHIKKETLAGKSVHAFYWRTLTVLFFLLMSFQQSFAQFKVIGYLPTWGGNLADVQYTKLTHINYAFLIPNSNGTVQAPDDPTRLKNLVSQAHANNVKVIISVGGGGGGDAFKTIVASASLRNTFVNTMVNFCNQYNLDGSDIDWEFPSDGTEANNFATMMQQLSTAMHNNGKLCTAAVIAYGGTSVTNAVFSAVDFLNIMAYDENNYDHSTYDLGVKSVNYWVGRGLPASKACLGVPFYGRDNCCDYKTVDYSAILAMGGSPNADTYNNQIGYNGIPTIKKKTAYAMGACAGIMIWSIDTDAKGANSLLSAINDVVVANSNPVPDNLAKGKAVTVSSTEASTTTSTVAGNATDGSYNTRWSSLFADPQWLTVDLGGNYNVNRVKLTWEAAYATAYKIQISSDNSNWVDLKSVTGNATTTNDQTGLSGTGRYVRIYGTARATAYGYSLYEIEVYGTAIESPYTGTAINLPGKIEAENFDLGGEDLAYHDADAANQGGAYRTTEGVDVQATTDTGAGYNVGYIAAGEWLKYMVNVTAAGNYDIAVRVAATAAGSTLHIELDGTNITGAINVPNTGAWQTWQTVTLKNVALTAGAKTMKVSMDAGSFNLNYITVQSTVVAVNQAPTVSLTAPANGASVISPATIAITASASDVDGTVSKVDFYNGTTLLGTSTTSPYAFTWSNVATGTYAITAKATDNSGASTTSAAASVTVTAPVVNDCPKLTWSDEFNGTSLDQSKWNYQTGDGCPGNCGWGNNELEYYTNTTNNVSVSGGNLALTARYEPNYNGSGKNYTSGKLVTSGKFSQKYGRYEARIKAPSAASIWPAFWMLADNTNWPATGEIDILECLNAKPTLWYGTLHYASTSGVHQSKGATWTSPAPLSDDYHVYAVEWSTTQISWFIDGTLRGTATKADVISGGGAWPFDNQNFFIILNVAVGGNFPGQTPISSQFPVSMLVDYVRVYSGDPCTVTQAPYGGTAWPIPGTIEAENYDIGGEGVSFHDVTSTNDAGAYRQDAVDIEASTDTGAGYDVGYTAAGEWLKYTVNVTASANYDLAVRVAATAAGKSMHVEIDGVNISGAVAIPNTGGWQTWQTVTIKNIPLTAGQRMLRIVMDTDGFNLNKIIFTPSSTTPPPTNLAPVVSLTAPANNASQNAPASITISATASDADGTVSKVDFYNGTTLLSSDATAPYSYTWTNVAAGTYNISAKATDNAGTSTTSAVATVKVNTVVSSNTCSGIAQYVENGGYAAGSKVQSGGSQYQCKPYPYSGWCNGAAWAYGPGSGSYWTDAWTLIGTCSAARTESSAAVNDAMLSNAPNPFTGMTNVQVTVQQAGDVSLQVFDKTGQVVATIFEGYLSAGTYDYTLDATHLKADLYIVKFNSNNGVIARKIVKSE